MISVAILSAFFSSNLADSSVCRANMQWTPGHVSFLHLCKFSLKLKAMASKKFKYNGEK
jgi:hypothetical protein